ncbi:arsenate reductase/protein-tyrosine-phosphatase family protein [Brachybacterium hainanense]|uniref:Phosphotyrosine protein phosphatase I domain-containing protein n=1 Tax=Brachybacterium hainanense TaxID=1541174 RepID=A0ABV6RCK2_9MICO
MTVFSTPASADGPVRSVLFVCTGNVCRSPFAELLLRTQVAGLAVASRGTYALVDSEMEQQMAGQLSLRGVSSAGFRSRQLEIEDLEADLVLTMSDRQRALILEENPAAARRTGQLGHVPELLSLTGGAPLTRERVADWSRRSHPAGRNVPDPYRRSPETAARSAQMIDDLVAQLADLLQRRAPEAPRR